MTFRNSVGEIYSWPEIANIQITGVSSCFWGKIGQQCQRVKDVNKENAKFLCNSKQRLCCFQCGVDWYYGPIEKVFLYTGRYKLFIFSPLVKGHLSWVCSGLRYLDQFCGREKAVWAAVVGMRYLLMQQMQFIELFGILERTRLMELGITAPRSNLSWIS